MYKISLGQCVLVSASDSKLFDCMVHVGLVVRMLALIHLKSFHLIGFFKLNVALLC